MSDTNPYNELEEQDRFDAIILGTATPEEQQIFELELKKDDGLAERFRVYERAVNAIRASDNVSSKPGVSALRSELKAVDRDLDGKSRSGWWKYGIAASLLALFMFWFFSNPPSNQKLAQEFQYKEIGLPVTMGGGSELDEIMNAYKQGEYDHASNLLDKALVSNSGNDTLQYFKAVVTLEIEGCSGAYNGFEQVPTISQFFDRANYQLALCDLMSDELDKARSRLKDLQNCNDPQLRSLAVRLLKKLK